MYTQEELLTHPHEHGLLELRVYKATIPIGDPIVIDSFARGFAMEDDPSNIICLPPNNGSIRSLINLRCPDEIVRPVLITIHAYARARNHRGGRTDGPFMTEQMELHLSELRIPSSIGYRINTIKQGRVQESQVVTTIRRVFDGVHKTKIDWYENGKEVIDGATLLIPTFGGSFLIPVTQIPKRVRKEIRLYSLSAVSIRGEINVNYY